MPDMPDLVLLFDETSMIRLTQTRMKIHHASSILPIKDKLFTDEMVKPKQQKFSENKKIIPDKAVRSKCGHDCNLTITTKPLE
jgi:hypothetical protein